MSEQITDLSSQVKSQQDSLFGPGQLLRQARETKGWSVSEAAEKLNVIKSTIIAIENDDYHQIGAVVFIKGYLRLYARVLDVNEHDVINQFVKIAPDLCCELDCDPSKAEQSDIINNTTKKCVKRKKRSLFKWW